MCLKVEGEPHLRALQQVYSDLMIGYLIFIFLTQARGLGTPYGGVVGFTPKKPQYRCSPHLGGETGVGETSPTLGALSAGDLGFAHWTSDGLGVLGVLVRTCVFSSGC